MTDSPRAFSNGSMAVRRAKGLPPPRLTPQTHHGHLCGGSTDQWSIQRIASAARMGSTPRRRICGANEDAMPTSAHGPHAMLVAGNPALRRATASASIAALAAAYAPCAGAPSIPDTGKQHKVLHGMGQRRLVRWWAPRTLAAATRAIASGSRASSDDHRAPCRVNHRAHRRALRA